MNECIRRGYISQSGQLYSVRRLSFQEGRAGGSGLIEVNTAGGLQVDILPDSGLDIGQVRFQGRNMTFLSKNGYDGPRVFSPHDQEFMHTFPGGLMHTCGLRNAGPANEDNGEWMTMHGRIHGIPADQVCAYVEEEGEDIVIRGTIRETALFGHELVLKREIRIPCLGSEILVFDTVSNETPKEEEIMLLYHCNFSYPLLSENARLILPENRETIPRTPFAAEGLDLDCSFETPVDGQEERVYFQKMKDSFFATLQNPDIHTEMTLRWSGETLPLLVEWRSMASGDYCLGLEPSNSFINGRHEERARGTLPALPAFSQVKTHLSFAFKNI